jgi:hypothetical protein
MKIKILLLTILLGGILASSCDDFLSENPSVTLPPDEAITSIVDLKYAINGVMSLAISHNYYGGNFIAYGDLKGSDIYAIGGSNQIAPVGRYAHDKYSAFSFGYYAAGYAMMSRINALLEQIPNLPAGDGRNQLEGELYALRGLIHFDMARLFAQLPSVATDINAPQSGIPLADRVFPIHHKPLRATLKETYDQVIRDLTKGADLLSPNKKVTGRMNHWAAKALRARVHLYLEHNDDALTDAHDVITNAPYALLERADYVDSWSKEGASETLLEFLTTDLYNAQRNAVGYYCAAEGYAEMAVHESFRTLMNATAGDVRAELIQYEVSSSGGNKGYYPKKYPGRANSSVPLYANNPKVIRLSEVYLIAAEAAVKGGAATGAKTAEWYVNTLLAKRITGYSDATSVTLDDILLERRKELYAEGQMCWDAWRNHKSVDNVAKGIVEPTDDLCILPFPQSERDISPNLKQNPGY